MDINTVAAITMPKPILNALAVLAGHLGDDVYAANLRKDAESSRGTRTANTERALLGDVLLFTAWCTNAGLAHLPADVETVAAFIDAQAAAGKAPASIRRYAASIATYHRSARASNPLEQKIATDALKRMARVRGEKQHQAKGINDNIVVKMLAAPCDSRTRNGLVDLRNKALLVTAYTTLCRRGELVRLLVADLRVDADGFGVVNVSKSKTDQTGKGASVAITTDAMHHLQAWLTAARIESGLLFRSVNRHGQVSGRLDEGSVSAIFKAMATRARLSAAEVAQISAHSTRVGACQDMVRYGADIAGAMQAGRWRSTTMVSRYCEGLNLKRGAVAQVAARREQFV
jgi:site-specific recombinase XerD